jgi:hypothetical protein
MGPRTDRLLKNFLTMKPITTEPSGRISTLLTRIWILASVLPLSAVAQDRLLQPGDQLGDLSLELFESEESIHFSDFEGKIIYLEWFYWW